MNTRLLSAGSSACPPTHMTFRPFSLTPITFCLATGTVCTDSNHFLPSFTPIAAPSNRSGRLHHPGTRLWVCV